jgi:ferric-dicitrate binding protein FerR (iron transport regulator)
MKEKVDSRLIKRYANGHYSFHDLKRMALWFENLRYHDDLKSALDQHWCEFQYGKDDEEKDLSLVFDRLRMKILAERNQRKVTEKIRKIYMQAAAILLVPLLIYSAFSLINRIPDRLLSGDRWIEVVSPKGTRTHFDLPDGTKVSLNSSANLMYHADFSRNRLVRIKGEAWFDVFHDAGSPFVVQTDELDIRVLGTKFSVASLEEEKITEVILEEGKVQLTGKGDSFLEELNPNEGFFYNKETHTGRIMKVDAGTLTAWKEGKLIFRSEPLGNVLKRIGRWYNVRFEIKDKEVEEFSYRATFQDEPLEEVLRLISLTAPVEYRINDRNMNENGLYEDQVITIGLKRLIKTN